MLMPVFLFILYSLTTWRICYMLTQEEGPFMIFNTLRSTLDKGPLNPLKCFFCTSVWVGFFVSLCTGNFLLYWLPLSASAMFIEAIHDLLTT